MVLRDFKIWKVRRDVDFICHSNNNHKSANADTDSIVHVDGTRRGTIMSVRRYKNKTVLRIAIGSRTDELPCDWRTLAWQSREIEDIPSHGLIRTFETAWTRQAIGSSGQTLSIRESQSFEDLPR